MSVVVVMLLVASSSQVPEAAASVVVLVARAINATTTTLDAIIYSFAYHPLTWTPRQQQKEERKEEANVFLHDVTNRKILWNYCNLASSQFVLPLFCVSNLVQKVTSEKSEPLRGTMVWWYHQIILSSPVPKRYHKGMVGVPSKETNTKESVPRLSTTQFERKRKNHLFLLLCRYE